LIGTCASGRAELGDRDAMTKRRAALPFRHPEKLAGWLLACLLAAGPAAAADEVTLADVSVHLFLQKSGTLSADVTKVEGFAAWNVYAEAAGFEGGKFNGFLIGVRFTARGEAFAKGRQATIVLRDRQSGKTLETRTISDVYVGPEGEVHWPLFVMGRDCVPLEIVATGGKTRIVKQLNFKCGE
jgi:hypothetical protein